MESDKLKAEYGAYRKRAVNLMKDKDEAMRRASEELTAVRTKYAHSAAAFAERGGSPAVGAAGAAAAIGDGRWQPTHVSVGAAAPSTPEQGVRTGSGGVAPSSGGSTRSLVPPPYAGTPTPAPPDGQRWVYMRNLIVRYLSTPDAGVRAQVRKGGG
jgi:hypothetical protein